jgi:protein SDA1
MSYAADEVTASRLPQLQNLIKRDPESYKEEFDLQFRHFQSEFEIFRLRPTKESGRFTDLVSFISQTSSCYKDKCTGVPLQLMDLMQNSAPTLHPDVRATVLQALIVLRNKGMIDPFDLIKLAFRLISIEDKALRLNLQAFIIQDIKTINQDRRNDKLNRKIQACLFGIVSEDSSIAARKTVEILADLYRRRVWTDQRTVNVIAHACLNQAVRVMVTAINFFLGIESKMDDDDDEEKQAEVIPVNFHEHSKKTKKRARIVKKQIDHNLKVKRDKEKRLASAQPLFPAIQLLNNPHDLAEKLFAKLKQTGQRFEVKLLLMNFISRLIGCHGLHLLNFYRYLRHLLNVYHT